MSKIDNPYKSLEASTDYEKFLKKELVQLHDTITSQVKTIKDLDPIKEKRKILNDSAKAKVITLKQYKEISKKLEKDPKDFNIIKAIEFAKRKNAKEKEKEGKKETNELNDLTKEIKIEIEEKN